MRGDVVRFARLLIVSRVMIAACFAMNSSRVCSVQEPLLWGGSVTTPSSVPR